MKVWLVVTCVATVAVECSAQGLADAAARAESARRARPATTLVSNADLNPDGPVLLTTAIFRMYDAVRSELTILRARKLDLHRRLFDKSRSVSRLLDLVPALEAEPLVMVVLKKHGMTARDYLVLDQTLLSGRHYRPVDDVPTLTEQNSVNFRNAQLLADNLTLVLRAEQGWGAQWFDVDRFR